jgi:hypothetical protein
MKRIQPCDLEKIFNKMLSTLGDGLQCLSETERKQVAEEFGLTSKQVDKLEVRLSKLFATIVYKGIR